MLQILYILAFTILAFLAIGNLMRSMFTLGVESQRYGTSRSESGTSNSIFLSASGAIAHPELLDDRGNITTEPLLVMRSMTVEDARSQLNALYESSPGYDSEASDE